MMITVENAVELQELLQIANEQMKQLEITLSKIKGFQPKAFKNLIVSLHTHQLLVQTFQPNF